MEGTFDEGVYDAVTLIVNRLVLDDSNKIKENVKEIFIYLKMSMKNDMYSKFPIKQKSKKLRANNNQGQQKLF